MFSVNMHHWQCQIQHANQKGLRNGYALSVIAFLMGLFFFVLFWGPDVDGFAKQFFREARGWWPMFAISLVMIGMGALGVRFTYLHSAMISRALENAATCEVQVRFVDLGHDEGPGRFEAWFDASVNSSFGNTLKSLVWQRTPAGITPPVGQSTTATALLDVVTRTPIAVTVGESTYIFDSPATPA